MAFGRSFALSKGRRGIFDARDNVSACYTHKGKTDTTNDSSAGVDTAVLKKKEKVPRPASTRSRTLVTGRFAIQFECCNYTSVVATGHEPLLSCRTGIHVTYQVIVSFKSKEKSMSMRLIICYICGEYRARVTTFSFTRWKTVITILSGFEVVPTRCK